MASKGKRSQNTDFTASVVAVDIGGGIPFGVAQLLRQRQGILEGSAVRSIILVSTKLVVR